MKTCANCGTVSEAAASQCDKCGMSLPDAADAATGAEPLGPAAESGAKILRRVEAAFCLALIAAGLALIATGTWTIVGWALIVIGALGFVGLGVF
jgi:uncharacterized membrane protein YvbJ